MVKCFRDTWRDWPIAAWSRRRTAKFACRSKDVDFTCKSLDEAYQLQRNRVIVGRIDDHLNLADWCLRQNLMGYAAREIAAAMDIDPRNPRVGILDRRLKRVQELAQGQASSDRRHYRRADCFARRVGTPGAKPARKYGGNLHVDDSADVAEQLRHRRMSRTKPGVEIRVAAAWNRRNAAAPIDAAKFVQHAQLDRSRQSCRQQNSGRGETAARNRSSLGGGTQRHAVSGTRCLGHSGHAGG